MHAQVVVTVLLGQPLNVEKRQVHGFTQTCAVNAGSLLDAIRAAANAVVASDGPSDSVIGVQADEIDPTQWPDEVRRAFKSSPNTIGIYYASAKAYWADQ